MADRDYDTNRGYYDRGFYGNDWDYDQGYYGSDYYGSGYYGNSGNYGNRNFGNRGFRGSSGGSQFNRGFGPGYSNYGESYYGSNWNPGNYGNSGWSGGNYGRNWGGNNWFVPGPYFGQGPQNYRRSDERILEDVADRLTFDGRINAANINLTVNDGDVTLDGAVGSRQEKRFAEDDIDSIPGVKDVHNNLRVDKNLQSQGWQGQQNWQSQQGSFTGNRFTESGFGQNFKGQIHQGMDVLSSDGQKLGTVKDFQGNQFTLNRSMHPDLFVPFSAIQDVTNNQVRLSVAADQIDKQGWLTPETSGRSRM